MKKESARREYADLRQPMFQRDDGGGNNDGD
jgi:hypothetical protein